MIRVVHAVTGTVMWVHESRVEEYLALGHRIEDEATARAYGAVPKPDTAPDAPAKRKTTRKKG